MSGPLRAPFPYFGGKRDVADMVWRRFGRPKQYLEPFCGSAAVLLAAPEPAPLEVVVDLNGFIANFWRAVVHQAEDVARWADYPVSHVDLGGRHRWLLAQRERLGAELQDPDWPGDAKAAGWWLWGACAWIGSGWCVWSRDGDPREQKPRCNEPGTGIMAPSQVEMPGDGERAGYVSRRRYDGHRAHASIDKRPDLSNHGRGVHSDGTGQVPFVGTGGRGVQAPGQIPFVNRTGQGVQSEAHLEQGVDADLWTSSGRVAMGWLRRLASRLERVRVIHGDWSRGLHHYYGGDQTAVFLDPPYEDYEELYGAGASGVAAEVGQWCRENAKLRVALCGHRGDHALDGWDVVSWERRTKTWGGDGTRGEECIWFSPGCLPAERSQLAMF